MEFDVAFVIGTKSRRQPNPGCSLRVLAAHKCSSKHILESPKNRHGEQPWKSSLPAALPLLLPPLSLFLLGFPRP